MSAEAVTLVEHQHLNEMNEDLQRKLQEVHRQEAGGRIDSLRAAVMGAVVSESYDRAKDDLRYYVAHKKSFPIFQERVERYVQHCCELIAAIETKRNFPGLATLSLAKQQEIHERVLQHFEELKQNLKQIEKVEREYKLADLRSTVWVVRSASYVVMGIVGVAFFLDMQAGLLSSIFHVVNVAVDNASSWIIDAINL